VDAVAARTRPLVIFDGDCGFCTTSATWIARRLHRANGPDASLVPRQRVALEPLGTTDERASREVLWVGIDGAVHGGAEALARWLRFRGGPYGWLGRLLQAPVVSGLAAGAYRLVAANRYRLPGGTPACALPPPGATPPSPG
jgi:predicted DCC family thiol-disulfide oxidoreductase YuxK